MNIPCVRLVLTDNKVIGKFKTCRDTDQIELDSNVVYLSKKPANKEVRG